MCPWSTARRPYQQPNQLYRTILDKPRLREGPGARSPRLLAVAVADLVPAMDENRVCRPTRGTCSLSLERLSRKAISERPLLARGITPQGCRAGRRGD